MPRRRNLRKVNKKKRRNPSIPSGVSQPRNITRRFTHNVLLVVNNAGALGANSAIQCYNMSAAPFVANVPGLLDYLMIVGANGLYTSARVKNVHAKVSMSNQEAFAVRATSVINDILSPANTLFNAGLQAPYMSNTGAVVKHMTLGPLTGNSKGKLNTTASLSKTLGVTTIRGLADVYSNSLNTGTSGITAASQGLVVMIMILSAVNLVTGVLCDIEIDFDIELWGVNPTKS